ncbi:hypothetical protein BMF94_3900 [Rhodotorula taiwanensis]|uniref:Uncharacterized protein n=1 Tax=Rhodotorula taiwanensis TaxID=741276 RepID=A0A2S5B8F7_9BASI|nr:hypothetical protein BMF94_3900 [Rhodotorula taiwanensis]
MPHSLVVEGDKVIEKSADGEIIKTSDYNHVIGGYKATLKKANVSEEAKAEARALLHDLEKAHKPFEESGEAEEHYSSTRHRRKSVSQPSPEKEETEGAEQPHHKPHRYEEPGDELPLPHEGETHEEIVHRHRVAGTFKGILHRQDASEETKAHARDCLDKMGVSYEE